MATDTLHGGTLAERVTVQLRNDILNRQFEVGERITIKEISEKYGVSNMPVREAFRTLEGESLLEINAYKGATVLMLDRVFIQEVYGILRALEGLIYETAVPNMDAQTIAELRDWNRQIRTVITESGRKDLFVQMNGEFHDRIIALGTNRKAKEMYRYYHSLVKSLRQNYMPGYERCCKACDEHEELLNAFEAQDLVRLREAVDSHSRGAMADFLSQYTE